MPCTRAWLLRPYTYITTQVSDWLTRKLKKIHFFSYNVFLKFGRLSMVSLSKYFLWFFVLCLVLTVIMGLISLIVPNQVAGILIAFPYLISMIIVLHLFLKQQKRAPTEQEKKKFTIGFSIIFWSYNLAGLIGEVLYFSRQNPEILTNFLAGIQNIQFLMISIVMLLMLAIPLYLITYWFYGKQAKRMATKMFGA